MKTPERNVSVSRATQRAVDIIPAFAEYLPAEVVAGVPADLGAWCDSRPDEAAGLVAYMLDELDAIAPTGCYFGAHTGDGSDYGWWDVEEGE